MKKQWLNIKIKVSCLCGSKYEIEAGSMVLDDAIESIRSFVHFHKGHKRLKAIRKKI